MLNRDFGGADDPSLPVGDRTNHYGWNSRRKSVTGLLVTVGSISETWISFRGSSRI
jgi:hypothetical protein